MLIAQNKIIVDARVRKRLETDARRYIITSSDFIPGRRRATASQRGRSPHIRRIGARGWRKTCQQDLLLGRCSSRPHSTHNRRFPEKALAGPVVASADSRIVGQVSAEDARSISDHQDPSTPVAFLRHLCAARVESFERDAILIETVRQAPCFLELETRRDKKADLLS